MQSLTVFQLLLVKRHILLSVKNMAVLPVREVQKLISGIGGAWTNSINTALELPSISDTLECTRCCFIFVSLLQPYLYTFPGGM